MTKVASVGPMDIVRIRNLHWGLEPATHVLCGTVSEPEASTLDPAPYPSAATVHPGVE